MRAALALTMAILLSSATAQAQTVTRQAYGDKSGSARGFLISKTMKTLKTHAVGRAQLFYIVGTNPDRVLKGTKRTPDQLRFDGVETYEHQWPGSYFEAAFQGSEVFVKFDDDFNRYTLAIDGKAPMVIDRPGNAEYRVGDLTNSDHRLRLEKVTESLTATGRFQGFYVTADEKALPAPPARTRQVEIVGDSYAAGYGTLSAKRECTQDEIRDTTDTQQAFGTLLAKHYDADYQINAVSGIGMVRNYGGNDGKHPPLPALYPYALFDSRYAYDDPSWQPSIVVIALGDNDFATEVQPGEKWADKAALAEDFISTYATFVQSIRARNPKATFVLMDFNEDALPGYLAEVAARLKTAGETRVLLYHPGGAAFEQTGCDWHLSLNDHRRLAEGLAALIDSHPDIWQRH